MLVWDCEHMATSFPATDEIQAVHVGVTAAITDNGTLAAPAGPTSLFGLSIADTLVLSVFSAVYEIAVILLRIRSKLSTGVPQ